MRHFFFLLISFFPFLSFSQSITSSERLQQQSERRQAAIDKQLFPIPDGRLTIPAAKPLVSDISDGKNCFTVKMLLPEVADKKELPSSFFVALVDAFADEGIAASKEGKNRFRLSHKKRQNQQPELVAPCLGVNRISRISTKLQNRLISKGFITSRVLIPEQNLSRGELRLRLTAGKVGQLKVNQDAVEQTHANRANLFNAFPTQSGRILNLRDLEQGLENLRRVPTVSADMEIKPSQAKNQSDVVVNWQQRQYPFRLNFSVDDSGSKSTGKYLGTLGVAWDNPLHLNDIFYASYTRNLKSGKKQTDKNGKTDKGKTDNYVLNYSVPLGYWLFDIGMSDYHYDQVVAGVNRNYHYTGDSTQGSVNLSKILYRDGRHKITAKVGLWRKTTKNFIDDSEVEVQRRRTGGWKASLLQKSYFKLGTLETELSYKRGTRAFGAIAAPEELPFKLGENNFDWHSQFHGQWNKSLLTPQDRLAIGGRYSVRGFSGERTLSGDRGWYLRNDLSWHYKPNHQIYLGLDTGRVSGISAQHLLGKSLTGSVLGLKGQFKQSGNWYYDIFVGKPLHQPDGFDADSVVTGFNLNYSF